MKTRLHSLGRGQAWLAEELGAELGVTLHQSTISKWLQHPESLPPATVFAIERVLDVEPGTFSQRLGYRPLAASDLSQLPLSLEARIAADLREHGVPEIYIDAAVRFVGALPREPQSRSKHRRRLPGSSYGRGTTQARQRG
jgi:hypothetical protein